MSERLYQQIEGAIRYVANGGTGKRLILDALYVARDALVSVESERDQLKAHLAVEKEELDKSRTETGKLRQQVADLKKEYREELREAQRDCQMAYTEGRLEAGGVGRGEW